VDRESFAGSSANAAHINVIVGPRSGPVGSAWARSLATPRIGYIPFVAVLAPTFIANRRRSLSTANTPGRFARRTP
jgi:5,6,7,8-tetrahydromethanopterin hydro-lyase